MGFTPQEYDLIKAILLEIAKTPEGKKALLRFMDEQEKEGRSQAAGEDTTRARRRIL